MRNVVPVRHDLPTAAGCGVQNPPLPLAGGMVHGVGRRLNGRDGGSILRPMSWVAV
jgi:hypothetical protein